MDHYDRIVVCTPSITRLIQVNAEWPAVWGISLLGESCVYTPACVHADAHLWDACAQARVLVYVRVCVRLSFATVGVHLKTAPS
jgi:hypothetical protein